MYIFTHNIYIYIFTTHNIYVSIHTIPTYLHKISTNLHTVFVYLQTIHTISTGGHRELLGHERELPRPGGGRHGRGVPQRLLRGQAAAPLPRVIPQDQVDIFVVESRVSQF